MNNDMNAIGSHRHKQRDMCQRLIPEIKEELSDEQIMDMRDDLVDLMLEKLKLEIEANWHGMDPYYTLEEPEQTLDAEVWGEMMKYHTIQLIKDDPSGKGFELFNTVLEYGDEAGIVRKTDD